jgi:hypothetical protein
MNNQALQAIGSSVEEVIITDDGRINGKMAIGAGGPIRFISVNPVEQTLDPLKKRQHFANLSGRRTTDGTDVPDKVYIACGAFTASRVKRSINENPVTFGGILK